MPLAKNDCHPEPPAPQGAVAVQFDLSSRASVLCAARACPERA